MQTYFEHSLVTDDIVVRQDAGVEDTSFVETHVGQMYPLIRVKDDTIEFPDIVVFDLEFGIDKFFPTLSFSIDDNEKILRESNFIEDNDIITIFVGNANDTDNKQIKNNYYVVESPSSDSTGLVNVSAILHVPEIWKTNNRAINGSAWSVLKQIAQECSLGFVSNISDTNDSMTWLQHQSNYDFIKYVETHAWQNSETTIKVFIDQFANLVVVDIKKLFTSTEYATITTAPISGEALENSVRAIATNNVEGEDDIKVQLSSWSPINDYGAMSTQFSSKWSAITINSQDQITSETEVDGLSEQLRSKSSLSAITNEHVHENYHLARIANFENSQWLQGIQLSATVRWYVSALFIGMTLPAEIYNLNKIEKRINQDQSVDTDQLQDVEPTGSDGYNLNERYTSEYVLQSIRIHYLRSSTKSNEVQIRQLIQLIQK